MKMLQRQREATSGKSFASRKTTSTGESPLTYEAEEVPSQRRSRWRSRKTLSSPPRHEHIKNSRICGAVLTEDKLETGRKTLIQQTLERKIHTESGWKGKKVIRSGPAPLGRDKEGG